MTYLDSDRPSQQLMVSRSHRNVSPALTQLKVWGAVGLLVTSLASCGGGAKLESGAASSSGTAGSSGTASSSSSSSASSRSGALDASSSPNSSSSSSELGSAGAANSSSSGGATNSSDSSSSATTSGSSGLSSASSSSSSSGSSGLAVLYAVNSGGAAFKASNGQAYLADAYFTGGKTSNSVVAVANTVDDALYQYQRWGQFVYEFPVPNGEYQVTLQLSEQYWDAAGKRAMSVAAEGTSLINNLDLFKTLGKNVAKDYVFPVVAVADGKLTLNFTASVDQATVCAIVVSGAGSNNSSSSNSGTSSSAGHPLGDAANGQGLFSARCTTCHNTDGSGRNNKTAIDPTKLAYVIDNSAPLDLAPYIEMYMPPFGAKCTEQCALDVAAYIRNGFTVQPSSGSSSSPSSSSSSSSTAGGMLTGKDLFLSRCQGCHGVDGRVNADGTAAQRGIIVQNWTQTSLTQKIAVSMPYNKPGSCTDDDKCASLIAAYILTWKPEVSCGATENALPRRLRPLTNVEYANTVNDLFGRTDGSSFTVLFGANGLVNGFDNNPRGTTINLALLNAQWNAAEILIAALDLTKVMTCATGDSLAACANTFVPTFGKKAFRRPLSVAETTTYRALFQKASTKDLGAKAVIQAMLMSPNFLYRTELGGAPTNGIYALTPYETASLLSYTFWGSMPDAPLLAAADTNTLGTSIEIRAQVARLLTDARAKKQLAYFGTQWLHVGDVAGLQRNETLYPEFQNKALGTSLKTELEMFLQELFTGNAYKVGDLFNANFTYANNTLGAFYGIPAANSPAFQKVMNSPQRSGLLTLGAILATNASPKESHPIKRGLLVRHYLLCQEFAPPPANVGEVEPLDPSKPTRERFSAHSTNSVCQSCHQYIDDIGFAFENFDAIGKYRSTEGNNLPIDATGSLTGLNKMTDTDKHEYTDVLGLSKVLATEGAPYVAACMTDQFQRYMSGVDQPDTCVTQNTSTRWQGGVNALNGLWFESVSSPSFLQRR